MMFLRNLWLYTTLSGTLSFLVCLLLSKLLRGSISCSFRYLCLKLCITIYLIPFPLLKHLLRLLLPPAPGALTPGIHRDPGEWIHKTREGIILPLSSRPVQTALRIWLVLALSLAILRLIRQIRFQRKIFSHLEPDPESTLIALRLGRDLGLRRSVRVFFCRWPVTPFAAGFFHPVIVLTELVPAESREIVLRHELEHILRRDVLTDLLANLVCLIHCPNPVMICFHYQLKEVQEMSCDEIVIRDQSLQQRRSYGEMILHTAIQQSTYPHPHHLQPLSSGIPARSLARRIRNIFSFSPLQAKKRSMALILAAMLLACALPVLAYEPDTADWTSYDLSGEEVSVMDWMAFEDAGIEEDFFPSIIPEDETWFSVADAYLIDDETGSIIIPSAPGVMKKGCSHVFHNGTKKVHLPDGNGGCTVKVFQLKYCTKCYLEKDVTLAATMIYPVCPH